MSVIKPTIHTHPFTTASYIPFDRVAVDTMGPFPVDDYGNTYLVVVVRETFLRVVSLYAVKDLQAIHAARALLQFVGVFGCPSQIQSDGGSQFVNDLIAEFIKLLGCENITTLAYSKEENAIVERANKEVLRHLRNILFDRQIKNIWSDVLPLVQRIMMSQKIESIGLSPAELVFGNSLNLDRGIFLPFLPKDTEHREITLSEWTAKLYSAQSRLLYLAEQNQRQNDYTHMNRAQDDNVVITEFQPNSYVLVEYPQTPLGKRPPSKIHPILKGPYRIINKSGLNEYTVQDLVQNKVFPVQVHRLRPFNYIQEHTNPHDVAIRDTDSYVVDHIRAHRGDTKKLTSLEFLVHWRDYDDSAETWEPWKNLRTTRALHTYLYQSGLKGLIPKVLRPNYPQWFQA